MSLSRENRYNTLMLPSQATNAALEDFKRARRQAAAREILRRLRGQPVTLLPFDEVYRHLPARGSRERGLQHIPLKAIVGSMGRYAEFSRDFLPRSAALSRRWARIRSTFRHPDDMPPIDVYKVGEVYFVIDGNHRVSVARQYGAETIRAYVTELETPVAITPESDLQEIILAAERQQFLERAGLADLVGEEHLVLSSAGKMQVLERQIEALAQEKNISFSQAARLWYQEIYLPVVDLIAQHDLLRDFPGRTATDLYIWITQHRQELEDALGWEISPQDAARDLTRRRSVRPEKVLSRVGEKMVEALRPRALEPGPKTGEWRREVVRFHRRSLFERVLVPLKGTPESWQALEQAAVLGRLEESRLLGLHVVEKKRDDEQAKSVAQEFARRCEQHGVEGEFALERGAVTDVIVDRARWGDLIVVHLAHPPQEGVRRRLREGFHRLIRRAPRPLLAVPRARSRLRKLLLAYDGSPKADEALFVAAYLAGRLGVPLTTLVVVSPESFPHHAIVRARRYLYDRRVWGEVLVRFGKASEMVLQTAEGIDADLILMGGYSRPPLLDVVIGSTVDEVLRATRRPVLICR